MKVKRKKIYRIKNLDGKKPKLPLLFNPSCGDIEKPLEEWIYGKLNRVGSSGIITFKNQTAFNGYDGRKVNLCKKYYLIYIFSSY